MAKVKDSTFAYLIDPNGTLLGLKNDRHGMKNWLNDITQRVNEMNDKEAIKTLFVINQKIGVVKGKNAPYSYPPELYERLQITVNKLLSGNKTGLRLETIIKLCSALDCKVEELIVIEKEKIKA